MNDRIAANQFIKCGGRVILRDMSKAAFLEDHRTKFGVADPCRIFQHLIKHRLKLAGRAADNAENFRGRGLLFKRFGGSSREFVQQAGVLNRDDRLLGEVRDKFDLFVGERANLLCGRYVMAPMSSSSLSIGTRIKLRAPARSTMAAAIDPAW